MSVCDNLLYTLQLKPPIYVLREQFIPEEVAIMLSTDTVYMYIFMSFIEGIPGAHEVDKKWCLDYIEWLFEDCKIPLNKSVMTWGEPIGAIEQNHTLFPIDFICMSHTQFPVRELLDYFLRKKAPSCMNYSWLLKFFYGLCSDDEEWCAKRLLDAGATPKYIGSIWNVSKWYDLRQRRRKECLLFMGIIRKKKRMSKGDSLTLALPRDIVQLIGRHIWSRRFIQNHPPQENPY